LRERIDLIIVRRAQERNQFFDEIAELSCFGRQDDPFALDQRTNGVGRLRPEKGHSFKSV